MQPNMKLCPQCFEHQKSSEIICLACGYVFIAQTRSSQVSPSDSQTKTIILTIVFTLGFIGLTYGSYYLGTKSNKPEVIAQTNASPHLSSTVSPTATSAPATYEINVNQMSNVNGVNINKPIKKTTSNVNSQPTDKIRPVDVSYEYGWVYFTESNTSQSGYYYFYKSDLGQKSGETIEIWTRKYPMYPKGFAKQYDLSKPVDTVLEKLRINCSDNGYIVLSQSFFDTSGSSIIDKNRGNFRYQPIVPGTTVESLKNRVCS